VAQAASIMLSTRIKETIVKLLFIILLLFTPLVLDSFQR
jgi:hypothetical protein